MNSGFLKLNIQDLSKGLVIAVIAVVLGGLQQAVTAHGVDFAAYDWMGVIDIAWKAACLYLAKNLISTEDGKVLGRIG